jgi:DNA-directed RNA polymerase specialized sigma24 family protein
VANNPKPGVLLLGCLPRLRAFVRRLVGDRESEQEIIQEISLRALAGEGPCDEASFLAWSYGIGRHVVGMEWRRRRAARAALPIDDLLADELCVPDAQLDDCVAARESLRLAVNDLEPDGLDLLFRRYVLERPGTVLAEELNLTPAALRMRLMRLRSLLRARRDDAERL